MGQQDISYKEFFSDPQNVADLLRGFVDKDFNNMQEVITMTRDFDAISRADERILERKRTIKHMISKGLTIEQIADYGGYDIKEVRACFDEK